MLLERKQGAVPVATFHALRLLTHEWMDPSGGPHGVLSLRFTGNAGAQLSAYALERPDRSHTLLLINKDAHRSVKLSVEGLGVGACTVTTYSGKEYSWHSDGSDGHPSRSDPPVTRGGSFDQQFSIPPWSLTVINSDGVKQIGRITKQ